MILKNGLLKKEYSKYEVSDEWYITPLGLSKSATNWGA